MQVILILLLLCSSANAGILFELDGKKPGDAAMLITRPEDFDPKKAFWFGAEFSHNKDIYDSVTSYLDAAKERLDELQNKPVIDKGDRLELISVLHKIKIYESVLAGMAIRGDVGSSWTASSEVIRK